MFYRSKGPAGKTLFHSRPLLISPAQGYVRPGPGKEWFATTTSVWREVLGFSNYEISNKGEIRRSIHKNPKGRGWNQKKPGDLLKVSYSKLYPYVHIKSDDGKLYTKRISNLICTASYGPPPLGKPNALHKDGNPRNNHPNNLYWGSQAENCADKERHGNTLRGEKHPNTKLTDKDILFIRNVFIDNKHLTYAAVAQRFNVTPSTIRAIALRKRRNAV